MTEAMENYLCFFAGSSWYIVPIGEVERICLPEDIPEDSDLKWLRLGSEAAPPISPEKPEGAPSKTCSIILQEEDGRYCVNSELVEGVISVAPPDQLEIPESLQPLFPWLLGAAVSLEKRRLLLLLDGQKLGLLTEQGGAADE